MQIVGDDLLVWLPVVSRLVSIRLAVQPVYLIGAY